jgi:beta-galactosidase
MSTIAMDGDAGTCSFDSGWRFSRWGLQADGTSKPEPTGLEQSSTDDRSWQRLDLPHDWAITGPFRTDLEGGTGKLPWKGIGWYRKHFTLPATEKTMRVFVDFDGAMAYAQVWLNGHYLGTWPYGYSSFRMELTPYLKFGQENVLAVRLDTEKWDSRWYPGAGIYRHVWLVKTDAVHVGHWGTCITTPFVDDSIARVRMAVTVDNQDKKNTAAFVHTDIFELNAAGRTGAFVAAFGDTTVDIPAEGSTTIHSGSELLHPRRWSPESPQRYIARTSIWVNGSVVDQYTTVFGIRTLEFTARNGFLLNGKRVDIHGTCNHHDLGALGAAINTSALKRQLQLLKDMGCNSLRTSHNPPAPELLELADEMGFLVWDEAFDCWKTGKRKNDYNKLFQDWHRKDLQAMVRRDRNHPSVFIWSVGNEVMDQRDVALTKHLVEIVHEEDPTRPVSNGYNDPDGGRESGAAMALDVMGVNYFFGKQAYWDADARYKDKPTIGSETSSCVSSRGEYFFGTDYSNWQVSSYDSARPGWGCAPDIQFRTLAKFPGLLGEYVWTGFDYLGEPTPYNSDETNLLNFRNDPAKRAELQKKLEEISKKQPPSRSSYFGILDLAGIPKDRFYAYQAQWRQDLPMAHIFPHWNWKERVGMVTPVNVYTSGDEAELFLNGKSLGRKKKTPDEDFRLVWNDVVYEPGELKVVAYKNGLVWAGDSTRTTGEPAKLSLTSNHPCISSRDDELAFIIVRVQDREGFTVPRSHPSIRFHIQGPGEIVATDNGDPTSFIPFSSHERPAFNGMALVIVRAKKGGKGKILVTAESERIQKASIVVEVRDAGGIGNPPLSTAKQVISNYRNKFTTPPARTPGNVAIDAPLLGNGFAAAAIAGSPDRQTYYLARNDFWRLRSGFNEAFPAVLGKMLIDIPLLAHASFNVSQDLYDAVTTSAFTNGDTSVELRSVMTATKDWLVVEIANNGKIPVSGDVSLKLPEDDQFRVHPPLENRFEDTCVSGKGPQDIQWIQRGFVKNVDIKTSAAVVCRIIGQLGSSFTLRPGEKCTVLCAMSSEFKMPGCLRVLLQQVGKITMQDIAQAKLQHQAWWRHFWNESYVHIDDSVIEHQYYRSQYNMASCSRDPMFPPGLFGSWITQEIPAWNGDYHLNYNYSAPFYALYSSNHLQQAQPYEGPLLAFMKRGAYYSTKLTHIPGGVYFPVGIGPLGIESTRKNELMTKYTGYGRDGAAEDEGLFFGQKSNAAYGITDLSMQFYRTYDPVFTRKVYPFVKAVAVFWQNYLKKDGNRFIIENDAIHEGSFGTENPILSLGLVRMVFRTAVDMSVLLGLDKDLRIGWAEKCRHLASYSTQWRHGREVFRYSEKGVQWWDGNTLGIQHIYPAGDIGLNSDSAQLGIARNTLDEMNRWMDFNGSNSFFPAAVRVAYDPDTILKKLHEYSLDTYPNGFRSGNPHGIENCSTVPNTINEMLCMSNQQTLRVFKVWPRNQDASFCNIRCEGAFLASSALKDSAVQFVKVASEQGHTIVLQNPWPGQELIVVSNKRAPVKARGGKIKLPTMKGEVLTITPVKN